MQAQMEGTELSRGIYGELFDEYRELTEQRDRANKNTAKIGGERYSTDSDGVIDLSSDNDLTERTKGLHGAAKYKEIQRYILETLADQPVELSDGRKAVVDRSDALHIANKSGSEKTAQIAKIKELVETARVFAEDRNAEHNKFDRFWYYKADVRLRNEQYPLYINVGKAKNDGSLHIYDITKKIRDTANRINGLERPKPNEGYALESDISKISIADFLNVVKRTHQSILSEDVLSVFGEARNQDGYYAGRVRYSTDDSATDGKWTPKSDAAYEMDEAEFRRIRSEMEAKDKQWRDNFLYNELGEEGAERYKATNFLVPV